MSGRSPASPRAHPGRKAMPRAVDQTPRSLRLRRDLLWLYLSQQLGMTAVEIERVCRLASRDHSVICRRLRQCAAHLASRGLDCDQRK